MRGKFASRHRLARAVALDPARGGGLGHLARSPCGCPGSRVIALCGHALRPTRYHVRAGNWCPSGAVRCYPPCRSRSMRAWPPRETRDRFHRTRRLAPRSRPPVVQTAPPASKLSRVPFEPPSASSLSGVVACLGWLENPLGVGGSSACPPKPESAAVGPFLHLCFRGGYARARSRTSCYLVRPLYWINQSHGASCRSPGAGPLRAYRESLYCSVLTP